MHAHIPAHPGWYVHTFAVYSAKGADPTHAADMQQTLTDTVTWCEAPYPCEVDTLGSGMDAFKQALAAPDP